MIITLPFPPSVNSLYSTDWKTKRRFKSKRYAEWLESARACLWAQCMGRPYMEAYHCPCKVSFVFGRPDKRTRDISNLIKACEDFLVINKVLRDDSDIHEIHAMWGDVAGVRIEIKPLAK